MKFKKPLSLLLAAVLLCFAVPLLETPALAAEIEIHEVATAGVYKWITITAGEGGAVTEVVQTGGVLPPGMSLGMNQDVPCLVGTPTTPGTYILTGQTDYADDAASWVYKWDVRLFVDNAPTPTTAPTPDSTATPEPTAVPAAGIETPSPSPEPTPEPKKGGLLSGSKVLPIVLAVAAVLLLGGGITAGVLLVRKKKQREEYERLERRRQRASAAAAGTAASRRPAPASE